jgi:hypothetical protein
MEEDNFPNGVEWGERRFGPKRHDSQRKIFIQSALVTFWLQMGKKCNFVDWQRRGNMDNKNVPGMGWGLRLGLDRI